MHSMLGKPEVTFTSRRSPVICTHGCVATSQPLASEIGLRILRSGGNAADACIAAVAALNVTEPCMTGIGGDAFCLFYDAKTKRVRGLNGSGSSPAALTAELGRKSGGRGGKPIPSKAQGLHPSSAHCVTVPGAAAAWADAAELFGTKPLAKLLQPAIELAEGGYPVNVIAAELWQGALDQLTTNWGGLQGNPGAAALLRPDGQPPKAGELMRMPELAATFRALATEGKAGFYRGRIAQAIVETLAAHGSVMTTDDLAAHTSVEVQPISAPFAGHTIHQIPPNGSGLVSLLALRILENLPALPDVAAGSSPHTTAQLHRIIEALRLAFADGAEHVADPAHATDISALLADQYTASRAALIDGAAARDHMMPGDALKLAKTETVYLTAVDGEGNACSFICSNYMGFGSGLVPRGCGFSLQNRGANFVLQHGHPNELGPRKRPYHTIIPAMVTNARGQLAGSFGVMGGFMQPQGHVQVLLNWLRHGMHPQAALDAPRLCLDVAPAQDPDVVPASLQGANARGRSGVVVYLEDGFPTGTAEGLAALGHTVRSPVCGSERSRFGRGQMIIVTRDPDGADLGGAGAAGSQDSTRSPTRAKKRARVEGDETDGWAGTRILWGGSDGRGDGLAIGW